MILMNGRGMLRHVLIEELFFLPIYKGLGNPVFWVMIDSICPHMGWIVDLRHDTLTKVKLWHQKSLFGPINAKKRTKFRIFADFSTLSCIFGPIMDNIDAPIDSDWLPDI